MIIKVDVNSEIEITMLEALHKLNLIMMEIILK